MNDAYYTQTGERPDLAALEVNPPESYIGTKIMPIVPLVDKVATIYYATVSADATAATSRSAGTGPTAVQISDSSTTATTVEHVTRGGITPDEAKQMGGIAKADVVGAAYAKRNVMNALETDIAAEILAGTASNTWDAHTVLEDTQTALDAMRRYEGRTALVGGTEVLKRIVTALLGDTNFGPVFSRLISGASPAIAATGMNFKAWMSGLAMFLGVDEVLAGDSAIWSTDTYDGHFAFVKLPDSDPLSVKYKPQLGRTYMFMPDGTNPWVIQSVADRVNVNNLYDAYCWYDTVALNTSAFYLIDGVAST